MKKKKLTPSEKKELIKNIQNMSPSEEKKLLAKLSKEKWFKPYKEKFQSLEDEIKKLQKIAKK